MSLCELCNKEKAREKFEGTKMCEMCSINFLYSQLPLKERQLLYLKKRSNRKCMLVASIYAVIGFFMTLVVVCLIK